MNQPTLTRRGFVLGAAALFAAPAIVRANSLMAVSTRLIEEPFLIMPCEHYALLSLSINGPLPEPEPVEPEDDDPYGIDRLLEQQHQAGFCSHCLGQLGQAHLGCPYCNTVRRG